MHSVKKILNSVTLATAVLGVSGGGVACAVNLVTPAIIAHADEKVPTMNLTVHKLMYKEGTKIDIAHHGIINDGNEHRLPEQVKPYDTKNYGKVTFTLYDVSKTFDRKADPDAFKQAKIDAAIKDIDEKGTASAYLKDARVVDKQNVDNNGVANFKNVPTAVRGEYHPYIIVETSATHTTVRKAEPTFVVTPWTHTSGRLINKTAHLYPKNVTRHLDVTVENEKDFNGTVHNKNVLKNVEFSIYEGKVGEGKPVGQKVTTDNKGTFSVKDLDPSKQYYLVQTHDPKTEQISIGQDYFVNNRTLNNKDNETAFSISDLEASGKLTVHVSNSKIPHIKKLVSNEHTTDKDAHTVNIGDKIPYELNADVPFDVGGNPTGIQKDMTSEKHNKQTKPYPLFHITDTSDKRLTFVKGVSQLLVTDATTKTPLKEGQDYKFTYDNKAHKMDVNFIVQDGHVSPAVAKIGAAHHQIRVNYDLFVSGSDEDGQPGQNVGSVISNNVDPDVPVHRDDNVVVDFTNIHVKKLDSGVFGTGVAKKALEGAEFHLAKIVDGKEAYYTGDANNKYGFVSRQWGDESKAKALTTDKNGIFNVNALGEGKYVLKETKAPDGYQLAPKTTFTVKRGDHGVKTVEILDDKKINPPMTGSNVALISVVLAGLVGAGAVVVIVRNRKLS